MTSVGRKYAISYRELLDLNCFWRPCIVKIDIWEKMVEKYHPRVLMKQLIFIKKLWCYTSINFLKVNTKKIWFSDFSSFVVIQLLPSPMGFSVTLTLHVFLSFLCFCLYCFVCKTWGKDWACQLKPQPPPLAWNYLFNAHASLGSRWFYWTRVLYAGESCHLANSQTREKVLSFEFPTVKTLSLKDF